MAQDPFIVRATTHPVATWWFRHIASRIDPVIFKLTNGKFFSMGPAVGPMVTIVMTGRKSGKQRQVHLGAVPFEGHLHVVASAWGQERHPGWRYNLEADPVCVVQAPGERYAAFAEVLTDEEKAAIWPTVLEVIPQIGIYETRTDRNIRVFRLRPAEEATG